MAVQPQTPFKEFIANGVSKEFPLEFDVLKKDHLVVLINDEDAPVGSWLLDAEKDSIIFQHAPTANSTIKVRRDTPLSRSTDYQTYNSSFNPPAVNIDFDNIWLKLQEMGVLNWMVENNVKDLNDYVDSLNDETKAIFLEMINKQGLSLNQLDQYVEGLYSKLANVAVDKGWFAEFIADGNENQKKINNDSIRKFETLSDLLAYIPRNNGQTVRLKTKNGFDDGRTFVYDSAQKNVNNGGTVLNGWVYIPKGTLKTSWWSLPKSTGNCYEEFLAMVNIAKVQGLTIEVDLPGIYDLGNNYFPVRNPATPTASITFADYNNLTIKCVEGVIFKTTATTGRDVFQLNAVKNFKLLGFPKITSSISDYSGAGSNGVSITHGGENLTLEVEGENLPFVVKSNYVDGGKVVSIQTGSVSKLPSRNINIFIRKTKNVGYGFNADINSLYSQTNPISNVKVRGFIEDAYRGIAVVLDQSALDLGANGLNTGIDIDVVTKDCQQHYIEQRAWNLKSNIYVINTKAASSLRKDVSYDTEVYVASITGKKYGSVFVGGSVMDVDTLYRVGGTGNNGGSTGACTYADINFKVNFTAATKQFDIVNSGGNNISSCEISIANVTTLDVNSLLSYNNIVYQSGSVINKDFKSYNSISMYNLASAKKWAISSNGMMELSGLSTGVVGASQVKKIPIRDLDDNIVLYIPAYSA